MAKANFVPAVAEQATATRSRKTATPTTKTETESEEKVLMNVPKPFRLTDDNHEVHHYQVGKQMMPKSHAEHFYSVANGVTPTEV